MGILLAWVLGVLLTLVAGGRVSLVGGQGSSCERSQGQFSGARWQEPAGEVRDPIIPAMVDLGVEPMARCRYGGC
jgi:hypothetical protein